MIQVYQDNYPAAQRGHLFSRTTVIRVAAAAVFAELAGRLLTTNLELYRWLLVIFAVAFVVSALLLWRIPRVRLPCSTAATHYGDSATSATTASFARP